MSYKYLVMLFNVSRGVDLKNAIKIDLITGPKFGGGSLTRVSQKPKLELF